VPAACAGEVTGGDGEGPDLGTVDTGPAAELLPGRDQTGTIEVTLHPGPKTRIEAETIVSFGVPFPPNVLTDTSRLRALDPAGAVLALHAEEILPWRAWPGRVDAVPSVRAAMVSVAVTFADKKPYVIRLEYGRAPGRALAAPADPRADWVLVKDAEVPRDTVMEPPVYATFTPDWLSDCLLRTRTTPVGSDPAWDWFDESLLGSARTAVNDVPAQVTERVDYQNDNEPWLFDRTATLFNVYVRTGDVKWLRHAHRSAQLYRHHITPEGYLDLKDGDLKYSYGRSLLMDFLFTGDPALIETIDEIARAGGTWNAHYKLTTNFWTERHQTYALLAALSAWEATGAAEHAARVREVVEASFGMVAQPAGSWRPDGCMLHGMEAHEGAGGTVPICSPWMSALFGDAVWEYYIHTADQAALEFLDGLGQYVVDRALYGGDSKLPYTMPWYLASSATTFSDDGPFGDVEHTCDVAALVARAGFARLLLGGDPGPLRDTAADLLPGCQWVLNNWHRPGGLALGKAEWRISPARKFNWWFGTTSDLPWLMRQLE
jgi:hypothetical protein